MATRWIGFRTEQQRDKAPGTSTLEAGSALGEQRGTAVGVVIHTAIWKTALTIGGRTAKGVAQIDVDQAEGRQ